MMSLSSGGSGSLISPVEIAHQMPIAASASSVTPRKIAAIGRRRSVATFGPSGGRNLGARRLRDRRAASRPCRNRRCRGRTARGPAGRAPYRSTGAEVAAARGAAIGNVERRVRRARRPSQGRQPRAAARRSSSSSIAGAGRAGRRRSTAEATPAARRRCRPADELARTAGMNSVSISAILACRSLRRLAATSGASRDFPATRARARRTPSGRPFHERRDRRRRPSRRRCGSPFRSHPIANPSKHRVDDG